MSPVGPNLSHWPGNRTPAKWKADLSTGICLRFAKACGDEQMEFLCGATVALNDHYDTDGFLSLLCVLRPDVALPREALLLEAAATGDYQAFHGRQGFAVDRIVRDLATAASPVHGTFAGLSGPDKDHARYSWLLEHAVDVLDSPERFASMYTAELAEVEAALTDPSISCARDAHTGLACIRSREPVHRMVLNTLGGDCFRVLHSVLGPDGPRYRFHDRTESWFEVVTFNPPRRRDLAPLRDALASADTALDGTWCLDPATEPVPELYHGIPASQEYGQITRRLTPSRLSPDDVEARFRRFFAESG